MSFSPPNSHLPDISAAGYSYSDFPPLQPYAIKGCTVKLVASVASTDTLAKSVPIYVSADGGVNFSDEKVQYLSAASNNPHDNPAYYGGENDDWGINWPGSFNLNQFRVRIGPGVSSEAVFVDFKYIAVLFYYQEVEPSIL